MKMGKVIGTVWATRKDEQLIGMKFLIVRNLDFDRTPQSGYVVAVDSCGAGVGEEVLYASGSSARLTINTDKKPVDAVIMAIIDKIDLVEQGKH
jgi:ethanolamine utilization protein EutN